MQLYITKGVQQIGPFSEEELRKQLDCGEAKYTDLAWHEGLSDWVTVVEILQDTLKPDETGDSTVAPCISESHEMAVSHPQQAVNAAAQNKIVPPPLPTISPSFLSSPVPVSPDMTSGSRTEDGGKKVTAGLLGILLGGFGIHKFYLGYPKEGLIQLAATVLTCGLAVIVGLIEGIIYLTMSKESFVKTYLIGRKGWF
jgi:TM2 domain-containing membrane protein YozV